MPERRQVLVVDDDEGVRTSATWALEADGFEVVAVDSGIAAIEALVARCPSLVVLDLSLPGIGGLDILRRVRASRDRQDWRRLPIIVLSGRAGETDRIVGLDLGADDYLVKPFSPGELAARARSLLRRSGDPEPAAHQARPSGEGVEIDVASRHVWLDGEPVDLPAKEFDLLAYLLEHRSRVCTRAELLNSVWASHAGWQTEATVTEHVYRLRRKLEDDPRRPLRLRTVRSIGYRWAG